MREKLMCATFIHTMRFWNSIHPGFLSCVNCVLILRISLAELPKQSIIMAEFRLEVDRMFLEKMNLSLFERTAKKADWEPKAPHPLFVVQFACNESQLQEVFYAG